MLPITNNPDYLRLVERYAVVRQISLSTVIKDELELVTNEMKAIERELQMDSGQIVAAHLELFVSRERRTSEYAVLYAGFQYDIGSL